VTRRLRAELLHDAGAVLGEGPAWDARNGELAWVDIVSGALFLYGPDGDRRGSYQVGGHLGSALPAEAGGWLLVTADGFAHLHRDGSIRALLEVEADRPELRFNDAKCDPWGQALAGTMRYDELPGSGTLYRLEGHETLTARVLVGGVGLSNGIGWSPEGDLLYHVDSLARTVTRYRYEPDGASLGHPQVVVTTAGGGGLPDGMCVDDDGCLWVALYGGGAVHRYRPDGTLDTVVDVPVSRPTSVAFGGPSGKRLFITSAGGSGRADDRAGGGLGDGGLWSLDLEVGGPPAMPWQDGARRFPQAIRG
jgi:sugar lactone lactonase YvrE